MCKGKMKRVSSQVIGLSARGVKNDKNKNNVLKSGAAASTVAMCCRGGSASRKCAVCRF